MRYAVIVIAGHRCAGKSTVAETLRRAGCSVLNMGTLLGPLGFRHCFNDEPLPVDFLIERYGGGRSVFPLFGPVIRDLTRRRGLLFIDSAKAAADIESLRRIVPGADVRTLFLDCPFVERHRRFVGRGREHDCGADALRAADETLRLAGFERLETDADWRLATGGDGGGVAIDAWLSEHLPRFLRGRRPEPAPRPAPDAAVFGEDLNALFAPEARDALHGVAVSGPLGDAPSALEAALADAAGAGTDFQRLNAIRLHERALRGAARPMRSLLPAWERAMRERVRRGLGRRGLLAAPRPDGAVMASPFLAPLTPLLLDAAAVQRGGLRLGASAGDAADYGRLRLLARERLELSR